MVKVSDKSDKKPLAMAEKVNDVNESIIKLVANLKSGVGNDMYSFNFSTPTKRPLSSTSTTSQSSLDEPSPSKRLKTDGKSDKSLNSSYLGSPREMRRLRADLVEARNTILNLENRIQHMHSVQKEMRIMFENETKGLKRQHDHDRKSIEELEVQLQSIRKREAELKQQLSEANNKCSMLKIRKDEEIEELEKSLSEIKEESRYMEEEESVEISNLNRKINELKMLLKVAEQDAETQKELVKELENQLAVKNAIDRDAEMQSQALQAAKLKIKELEFARESYLEFQEQSKTQAYKLAHYVELKKENDRLKEENIRLKDEVQNKLILEEEVYDLKTRLVNMKEQEKKLNNLQVQQVQTEMYLDEWRAVARGICESTESDSSLPHLLRSVVERLQHQEVHLTAAKVELESQLKTATYEAKVAKTELEKTQKLLTDLKKTSDQKQNLIHRMQKKLLLVSRERDSYRLQLDSYEKDLTMTINPPSSTAGGAAAAAAAANINNQLQTQKDRIENLEKIVDSYRELNAKLESELQNSNPGLYSTENAAGGGGARKATVEQQLTRLQEEVAQLRNENEMLKERKEQLEVQLEDHLTGHDTLHGGQVYHLANNPLAECLQKREQMVEKLEQEVERLKRKIKNMEEGLESSKLSESALSTKDVQSLKEQLKSQEAQMQRLKDCFRSSMQEFRDVIHMLFGYKIDRTATSLYKLTSIYADRAEDQLCFQLSKEETLNLLENEFSAALEKMVNLHLRHQKSIPVFLSAITIDLFNNKTMNTKTFEID